MDTEYKAEVSQSSPLRTSSCPDASPSNVSRQQSSPSQMVHQQCIQDNGPYSSNMSGKVCGAAFNTTPIYDAQGSLVGLQAPPDGNNGDDMSGVGSVPRADAIGYIPVPPVYQYNMASYPNAAVISGDCLPYTAYAINENPHVYSIPYHQQYQQHIHQQHLQQKQQQQHQLNQYREQLKPLLHNPGSGHTINHSIQDCDNTKPIDQFDKCPTVCSLFAILCCPITLWCSLPALAYSLCSYTDYRAMDMPRYRRKSDLARHLVITACVVGLILCISWSVLAFFYYEVMLATINDVIRVISHRVRSVT